MHKVHRTWKRATVQRLQRALVVLSVLALLFATVPIRPASAAAVTSLKDTLSRLQASTAANHTIQFTTPTGVAAGQTITLTFGSGFTMNAVDFADMDVADDGVDLTLAATASGATWGAALSGQVVTITSGTGTIAASSVIAVEIGTHATAGATGDTQITNPTASSTTVAIAGTFGDSGTLAINIIADDTVDITATVDPTITFSISDVAIGFGSLSSSTARWATGDALGTNGSAGSTPTAAHTLAIATNAQSGWAITYNGATLTSGSNTITVASVTGDSDGTPGSEQFGISASTDGDSTIASGYLRDTTADFTFVASTTTTLASESGETNTETISASYLANISTITEAGSYSTSVTYIATATF
ncbi:MAG: hypothetical protein HYZ09_00945 [Candidatus Kerfeldbacteria bacterium]|nr:hypothetical protein [Candidatus Kerfeldbacteria bacterium]